MRAGPETPVAVFDMDGTLTRHDSHARLLAHTLLHTPLPWALRASVLRGCASYLAGRRSNAWTKAVLGEIWQGRSREQLKQQLSDFAHAQVLPDLSPLVLCRLREHQERGHRVILLSASLDLVVEAVAQALGIAHHCGVSLAFSPEGRLRPGLGGPCYHGPHKATWLQDQGHALDGSWAYGNSFADRHILELVSHPVAVGPDPRLARLARQRGWEVLRHRRSAP